MNYYRKNKYPKDTWGLDSAGIIYEIVTYDDDLYKTKCLEDQIKTLCQIVGNIADKQNIDVSGIIEGITKIERV